MASRRLFFRGEVQNTDPWHAGKIPIGDCSDQKERSVRAHRMGYSCDFMDDLASPRGSGPFKLIYAERKF